MNTYETGDSDTTWTRNFIDGCFWGEVDEEYKYCISGPGFEISPTRTPWASWWRPQKGVVWALAWRDKGNRIPLLEFQCYGIPTYVAWAGLEPCQQYEWHDTFNGCCCCGQVHHLPDVAKESPQ